MEVAAIDLLPHELLLVIFKLYIDQETPARDLVALSLVCKLWRDVVEGTASLWCPISGGDRLPYLRKALAMARDVPLKIKYSDSVANIDPETFWAQIGGRISQYQSFEITTKHQWDQILAVLKQASTPSLKTLYLEGPWVKGWKETVVTLFEGEPASGALKDLHVGGIPLAIAPLRLSGLRSLRLHGLPIISVEEVLRLLRESPGLEECDLFYLFCLRDASFTLPPDHPTIQLSRLRSLNLRGLPISIMHLILSVIRIQKLRKFSVDVTIEQPGRSPISDLFTTKISHLVPSLKDLVEKAGCIEMFSRRKKYYKISVGGFMIELGGGGHQRSHLQETLNWVFSNLGGHLQALPVSLQVDESRCSTDRFIWLASYLNVTKLDLLDRIHIRQLRNSRPREIISLLSRPLESANNQWLLPDLESIEMSLLNKDGGSKILDMVNARPLLYRRAEGAKTRRRCSQAI
ncbi:hypothetical protein FRC05_002864 [Tulasnella sp. 425]|nr:hypothetical protein FRC05_002864 [Tulasnella sp. 425]